MKRRFENLTKQAGRAVRHWWLMLIAGVLCIAAGIAVFAFPLESYVTLSILFGVLLLVGIGLQHIEIDRWISDNTVLMILLATLIGIIPESGPHMIFVTLFAAGIVPFPVLLASSISQDGHASIPLLAESKKSFLWAKLINCAVALVAGLVAMLFV